MAFAHLPAPVPDLLEVSLCIFRPDGQDVGKARHMGLWFTYAEKPDEKQHAFGHAVSVGPGVYSPQTRINYDPMSSARFLRRDRIGYIRMMMTPEDIVTWSSHVRFNGRDPEMNCQHWVFNVLKALKEANLISEDDAEEGDRLALQGILTAPDYQ